MRRIVKLRRQGTSLVITIPIELLRELEWREGNDVLLETKPTIESHFKTPKILVVEKA